MKLSTLSIIASLVATALASSSAYGVLEFANFGYPGSYKEVASISNEDTDQCTCQLTTSTTPFSGPNSPMNEPVSVHFRGPLVLHEFAYYTGDSSSWTRKAYFNASSQAAENVTFLTTAGFNSSCLGKALTFADTDGVSEASLSTVLALGTKIVSGQEYSIFSNVTCGSSGVGNDCGVYRSGIPAYHGFDGAEKMFLFSFDMPQETSVPYGDVFSWNMPAIWLLNAKIPRTSQYPTNGNCSCWSSGCGEFDVFEVMNTTETTKLYSTIHDYQGTGDINMGLADYGYISRNFNSTMTGGVVFDLNGTATVFLSNSTSIDSTIPLSSVQGWVSAAGEAKVDTLNSVAPASTSTSKSKNNALSVGSIESIWTNIVVGVMSAIFYFV